MFEWKNTVDINTKKEDLEANQRQFWFTLSLVKYDSTSIPDY